LKVNDENSRIGSGSISHRHGSADPDPDSGFTPQCHRSGTLESTYIADLDAGQMVAEAAYPRPRDELAVIEFDSLEVVAVHQVVQAHVSDQRAVVQLYTGAHVSILIYAANDAQVPLNLCGNCASTSVVDTE
jgi:hypothetical protein